MSMILLPVDNSEHSNKALVYVLELAKQSTALEVVLLNAQLPIDTLNVREVIAQQTIDEYYKDSANALLKPYLEQLDKAGVPAQVHAVVGSPARAILDYADQHKVSAIVMGSHGRSSLLSTLLGSVTREVLQYAKCPVTIIR
jgi:nucleotide-binding universal stress UspA family protein